MLKSYLLDNRQRRAEPAPSSPCSSTSFSSSWLTAQLLPQMSMIQPCPLSTWHSLPTLMVSRSPALSGCRVTPSLLTTLSWRHSVMQLGRPSTTVLVITPNSLLPSVTPDSSLLQTPKHFLPQVFSARCNIYISRLCYDVSVRLSVTEVHWRIIANLGFKFWSQFTAHCNYSACGCQHWTIIVQWARGKGSSPGRVEGSSRTMLLLATARPSCLVLAWYIALYWIS